MLNSECSANVLCPLWTSQAGLRCRRSSALKHIRRKLCIWKRILLECRACNQLCLIEPPLSSLRRMQRHRNHQNGTGTEIQFVNSFRQHLPQHARRRRYPLIFQQVNQLPQFAIISTVCCRLRKLRPRFLACRTEPLFSLNFSLNFSSNFGSNFGSNLKNAVSEGFSANLTCRPRDRRHREQTTRAYRQTRNVCKRFAAQAAVGREKSGKNASREDRGSGSHGTNRLPSHDSPGTQRSRALRQGNRLANYVSGTAEDLASLVRRLVRLQPDELHPV